MLNTPKNVKFGKTNVPENSEGGRTPALDRPPRPYTGQTKRPTRPHQVLHGPTRDPNGSTKALHGLTIGPTRTKQTKALWGLTIGPTRTNQGANMGQPKEPMSTWVQTRVQTTTSPQPIGLNSPMNEREGAKVHCLTKVGEP